MKLDSIAGKKITLMGLGVLGRGVNVAKFLLDRGALLTITDLKSATDLNSSIKILEPYGDKITYVLERHRLQDFLEADVVIKAAGVPLDNKFIQAARDANVPVRMDASWCVEELPAGIVTIGITGTKGKSTVSSLIHYILLQAGKASYLAGNMVGRATLPLCDVVKKGDYLVLELDSWQLQGFHDQMISPHVAVFTNFMPDHLNYYQGMEDYYHDKSAIYSYQAKGDYLVLSLSSYEAMRQYHHNYKSPAKVAVAKPFILPKSWIFSQPGEHNRQDAAQAYQAAKFLGIDDEAIKAALKSFPGVPGRLELVEGLEENIKYYNDTNATTPDATAASITALGQQGGELILITGGVSKNFPDFDNLVQAINRYVAQIIVFPGGIKDAVIGKVTVPVYEATTMDEAVQISKKLVKNYSSPKILMSPAGSSFGLFKNEYDRGEQFNQAIKN